MQITINTLPYEWDKNSITYGELVKLAGKSPVIYYSVTYYMKRKDGWKRDGILRIGEIVEVIDGAKFDIYWTGNA